MAELSLEQRLIAANEKMIALVEHNQKALESLTSKVDELTSELQNLRGAKAAENRKWFSAKEAGLALGVSDRVIRSLIASGNYPRYNRRKGTGCWIDRGTPDKPRYEIHLENWNAQKLRLAEPGHSLASKAFSAQVPSSPR
jgi:hypothetical protein